MAKVNIDLMILYNKFLFADFSKVILDPFLTHSKETLKKKKKAAGYYFIHLSRQYFILVSSLI